MGKSEALAILSDIQAATFKNAAQLPLKESAQPEWQGIGFQIGGIRLDSGHRQRSRSAHAHYRPA